MSEEEMENFWQDAPISELVMEAAALRAAGIDPDEVKESNPVDNVNHPPHYAGSEAECIDIMIQTQGVEAVQAFCLCNAFKYLWRHKMKNGVEDIEKAVWYLQKYLELCGGVK